VQRFLSRPDDQPVTCGELVRAELAALASDIAVNRIVLEWPELALPKGKVQILALALHELATNALKHGALAAPRGHLTVTWRLLDDDGQGRHLTLDWLESGIDTVQLDIRSMRRGYGRELIEKALVYQLGAKTRFDLSDGSLHCVIEIPVERSHSACRQDVGMGRSVGRGGTRSARHPDRRTRRRVPLRVRHRYRIRIDARARRW
jgi:two-component system, chemotaxis family, CheB/CheR fusion protein